MTGIKVVSRPSLPNLEGLACALCSGHAELYWLVDGARGTGPGPTSWPRARVSWWMVAVPSGWMFIMAWSDATT